MAYGWICFFSLALLTFSDASVYDEDYDTYTKAYEYKNAGNIDSSSLF